VSVHERAGGRFEVTWRSPQHTQKCRPGCAKAMHQHARTFNYRLA
jgi:hypothetical protein